ncbi:DUF6009 family protein [Streptomyces sp. NPDC023998]|uniref:DUF6009 family protein n=1 Tax=Streptomyces sp. NPDC023998 TaxID=3154597 RepID=UPI003400E487
MVGCTELNDTADADLDSSLYRRRAFFLLPHDRDNDPEGLYREGAPSEAVDPRTIEPKTVRPRPLVGDGAAAVTGWWRSERKHRARSGGLLP